MGEVAIRSLKLASESVEYLNVTGPEIVSTKSASLALAKRLGREVAFTGVPADVALLSNSSKCIGLFGYPNMGIDELIRLQAEWLLAGGRELGKPTHFEEQRGRY